MTELVWTVGMVIMYVLTLPYWLFMIAFGICEYVIPFRKYKYTVSKFDKNLATVLICISCVVFVLGFLAKTEDYSGLILNIFNGLAIIANIFLRKEIVSYIK